MSNAFGADPHESVREPFGWDADTMAELNTRQNTADTEGYLLPAFFDTTDTIHLQQGVMPITDEGRRVHSFEAELEMTELIAEGHRKAARDPLPPTDNDIYSDPEFNEVQEEGDLL